MSNVAGILCIGSGLSLVACTVRRHRTGSALLASGSSVLLDGCTFAENASRFASVYLSHCTGQITRCVIADNVVGSTGAVAINDSNQYPMTITDTVFCRNVADGHELVSGAVGAGALLVHGAAVTIVGCQFIENQAIGDDEHVGTGGACQVQGGGDACFIGCAFTGNESTHIGGALSIIGGPTLVRIIASTFHANAVLGGFSLPIADHQGGAIHANGSCNLELFSSLLTHNDAPSGGGVSVLGGPGNVPIVRLANCTIVQNAADEVGGIRCDGGELRVDNGVLWNNCDLTGCDEAAQIGPDTDGSIRVSFSLVQGWTGQLPGSGVIDAEPLFVDATGPDGDPTTWQDNDYRLASSSPGIDAGNNWGVPQDALDLDADGNTRELVPFDLDGHPRFNADELDFDPGCGVPVVVDAGAYEYQFDPTEEVLFADTDGNFAVDVDDLVRLLLSWGPCDEACCLSDLDLSGLVDIDDLVALLLAWSDP